MNFIQEIVEYIEKLPDLGRKFIFSMTTNAVLLNKYMDYLSEKNFRILISLDGNKKGHSYRTDYSGKNSFQKVFENIKLLIRKYPVYFEECVNFNSVLHNRNSVESIYNFIKSEFGKVPRISELNNSGIREDKRKEFNATYRNKYESMHQSEDYEHIFHEMLFSDPEVSDLITFLHRYSGNVFQNYNDLLVDSGKRKRMATGTCIPFSRKMFLTVNGKIIPCERIDHCFALGWVDEEKVVLDFQKAADRFNNYVCRLKKQCETCYHAKGCTQCVYYVEHIEGDHPLCKGYMNQTTFEHYKKYILNYLSGHSELYEKIMKEILIN